MSSSAERLQPRPFALAQQQERQRPEQHGPGVDAQRGASRNCVDRLGRGQLELHARLELGHEVVVVRVEPLGHVQRRQFLGAPGHGEVGWQIDRAARPGEPLRHRPDHGRRVEHVVVEREIVRGDVLDAQRPLQLPMLPAQLGGRGVKLLGVDVAGPILLDRPLQFAGGRRCEGNPRFAAMAMRRFLQVREELRREWYALRWVVLVKSMVQLCGRCQFPHGPQRAPSRADRASPDGFQRIVYNDAYCDRPRRRSCTRPSQNCSAGPVVTDGAWGTQLQQRGCPSALAPTPGTSRSPRRWKRSPGRTSRPAAR